MLKPFVRFILLFALLVPNIGAAQDIRLHHYSEDNLNSTFSYPTSVYSSFIERFDLTSPIEVTAIEVWLDGPATATGELRFLGHEGGTSFPQFNDYVGETIPFQKEIEGKEKVRIEVPSGFKFFNDQFFVVLTNLNSAIKVLSETTPRAAVCSSSSGGDYYYQLLRNNAGNYSFGSRRAFFIDVIGRELDQNLEPNFQFLTNSGIDSTLGNATMAWADFNNDGFQDLLVAGRLYQNNGDKTFSDVTGTLGLSPGANANVFVDSDQDGDLDILFIRNNNPSYLYENLGGQFSGRELTELPNFESISSLSCADVNGDNIPDIFIGQLWGAYPEPKTNYLFFGTGENSFTDQTQRVYPNYDGSTNYPGKTACSAGEQNTWLSGGNRNKRSRGSMFVDYDNDGDPDLFVTNYFLERDEFYQNDGKGNFTEIISQKGIDVNRTSSNHGTGVDWADFDNDGDMDLLLPQFAHPNFATQYDHRATTVYINNGNDQPFEDTNPEGNTLSPPNGIQFEETYAGGSWGDFDNDGLKDFFITVFYGCRYTKLYRQLPDHTFELILLQGDLSKLNTGQDAVWVDIDNDGDLDLATGKGNRIRIAENKSVTTNNYVSIDLRTAEKTIPIGAKVTVKTYSGVYTDYIHAGRGTRMQRPYRLHFGIGNETIVKEILVEWNDSTTTKWTNVRANQNYVITPSSSQPTSELKLIVYPTVVDISDRVLTISAYIENEETQSDIRIYIVDAVGRDVLTLFETKSGQEIYPRQHIPDIEYSANEGWIDIVFHPDWYWLNMGLYFIVYEQGDKRVSKKIFSPLGDPFR